MAFLSHSYLLFGRYTDRNIKGKVLCSYFPNTLMFHKNKICRVWEVQSSTALKRLSARLNCLGYDFVFLLLTLVYFIKVSLICKSRVLSSHPPHNLKMIFKPNLLDRILKTHLSM